MPLKESRLKKRLLPLACLKRPIPIFVPIFFIGRPNSVFILGDSGKFLNSDPETKLT